MTLGAIWYFLLGGNSNLTPDPRSERTWSPARTPIPPTVRADTPRPNPTLRPLPTSAINSRPAQASDWGFVEDFSHGVPYPGAAAGEEVSAGVQDGRFRIAMQAPDLIWRQALPMTPEGRDFGLTADIASTTGSGAVVLVLESTHDDWKWAFLVDPSTSQWSVAHDSSLSPGYFTWVTPRSYDGLKGSALNSVEIRLVSGRPTLLINGVELGVPLEPIVGDITLGFGAVGAGFVVEFDQVRVFEL